MKVPSEGYVQVVIKVVESVEQTLSDADLRSHGLQVTETGEDISVKRRRE